jgi:hypothetical protein
MQNSIQGPYINDFAFILSLIVRVGPGVLRSFDKNLHKVEKQGAKNRYLFIF